MKSVDTLSTFSPGFIIGNQDYILLDKKAQMILGVDGKQLLKEDFLEIFDDEIRALFSGILENEEKGDLVFINSSICQQDKPKNILLQGSVIDRNADGNAVFFSGYCVEVKSEYSIPRIHDSTEYGLWDWNIVSGSCSFCKNYHMMLGYDWPREMLPKNFEDWKKLVHPNDLAAIEFQEKVSSCTDFGDKFECCVRLKHKDGNYVWTIGKGFVVQRDHQGRAIALQGTNQNIAVVRKNYEQILERSIRDSLTQCYNRNFFQDIWNDLVTKGLWPIGILYIDICGLKMVNDLLGHDVGDRLIVEVVGILQVVIQLPKYIVRMGGDEFVVILPECSQHLVSECERNIHAYVDVKRQKASNPVVFSSGSCTLESEEQSLASAIRMAERKMQKNKKDHYQENRAILIQYIEKIYGGKVEYYDRRL